VALIAHSLKSPGMTQLRLIRAPAGLRSPARTRPPRRAPLRIAAVQQRWHPDPDEHAAALAAGIRMAAGEGARLVCLQELTLSRYFAVDPAGPAAAGVEPEALPGGPTHEFAARMARETGMYVHASLYERADGGDALGYNTAILVDPAGELVARTRKLHIPVTAGYHEDRYFRPGPAGVEAFALATVEDARLGLPTCWDQWFPELARAYSLAGADVLVYPTAIGSEPEHPDFDTEPLWERVIVGNAIANGVFMVAVNRIGEEPPLRFYGSSFICDPYGRKLAQAPRKEPAVLVADLDLDQRRDWLELFPFLTTRRPDAYGVLAEPSRTNAGPPG
jgi:N-carbamoylputrescine amidase